MKLFILFLLFPLTLFAEPKGWSDYIESLTEKMQNKGISESIIKEGFANIEYHERVIKSDKNQAEFKKTFKDYYRLTVSDERIQKGKEAWKKNQAILKKVSKKFGVPTRYLLAFWGLETNYGATKGNQPLVSALVTLAFDGRRRTFFENQIEALFTLADAGKIELKGLKGSWAGAYGNFQFIPTTAQQYAVDGDGDGKIDLVNSLPDAFSSAANYLSKMGWVEDEKWGREVVASKSFYWSQYEEGVRKNLKEWNELGIRQVTGRNLPSVKMKAKLCAPQGAKGVLFLTYSNFDKIMKWNRSVFYALAIGRLADRVSGYSKLRYPPIEEKQISKDQIKKAQEKLESKGFYQGKIDGIIGKGMRRAIREYQKKNNLISDGFLGNTDLI